MTEQFCDFPTCQLARKKGFDEECRYLWMENNGNPKPIDPPKDTEIMENVRGLIAKHLHNLPALLEAMGTASAKPLYNSRLPNDIFTRPTQDLLERWMREVHKIVITIKYYVGPGYYYADLGIISRALMENGVPGGPFHSFELAREAAILHALKLLPDVNA